MPELQHKKFSFISIGLPEDTFHVIRFKGTEGLSTCYRFEVELVSRNAEIDIDEVLLHSAVLTILRPEEDIPFHGILAEFYQLHQVDEYAFYRAVLVPKLWWLTLTHHNQVFLNKSAPEMMEAALKDGGLTSLDYELRLQKEYITWEYACQYRESHYDFLMRWMEHQGMYYFFEQTPDGEKVVITDSKISHIPMPQGKTFAYSPISGLDHSHMAELFKTFECCQGLMPRSVFLKDYNYRKPSLEITGKADISKNGRGEIYIYGEHFRTPEEGEKLARVRAEEYRCGGKRFVGLSTIPYLRGPAICFNWKTIFVKVLTPGITPSNWNMKVTRRHFSRPVSGKG